MVVPELLQSELGCVVFDYDGSNGDDFIFKCASKLNVIKICVDLNSAVNWKIFKHFPNILSLSELLTEGDVIIFATLLSTTDFQNKLTLCLDGP